MIEVLKTGPLTTIQDAGRTGYRHLGIVQAGVMDPFSLRQANLLLGNEINAAVLEVSIGPFHFRTDDPCDIVLLGADYRAVGYYRSGTAHPLMPGYVHHLPAGTIVRMGQPILPGMRTYVAFRGGIDVPLVLGSRSTDITAGFGGLDGRPLQTGDRIALDQLSPATTYSAAQRQGVRPLTATHILRALPGPEHDAFDDMALHRFWNTEWRIDSQANRMGTRLCGSTLQLATPVELASVGVLPGIVQVPPDGQPIILGVDAQTMGGYPRIASVIHSDLWQLAYLPPGCKLLFREVTLAEARRVASRCDHALQLLAQTLRHALTQQPTSKQNEQQMSDMP